MKRQTSFRAPCLAATMLFLAIPAGASAANIVVNTLADGPPAADGACTLREAIQNANNDAATNADCVAGAGVDTITFAAAGTVVLGSELPVIIAAGGPLTIDGTNQVAISGANSFRVFSINLGATLHLVSLVLQDGKSNSGGAIDNGGTLTIDGSTLSENSGGNGGGAITNTGTLTINSSTLSGNSALADVPSGVGGAILNGAGGDVTISNSTLSNNSARVGGGIVNSGAGSTVTIVNSTVTANSVTNGGSGGLLQTGTGIVTISNSIIAGNSPGNCLVGGPFAANGVSLATDASCPGVTQVTSAALNLGPLFDNGGPTRTHALFAGSAAIDAGDQSRCTADGITRDQRGLNRDQHCDLGAYEAAGQFVADLRVGIAIIPNAVKDNKNLTYLITVTNDGPDRAENVVVTDTVPLGTLFLGASALTTSGSAGSCTTPGVGNGGVVRCNLGDLDPVQSGTATILVTVTARGNGAVVNRARVDSSAVDPVPSNNVASIQTRASAGK